MSAQRRPLRADAQRNRQTIISAASTVLAERGTDATLERIAEVAGVGVGTVYRRFPSLDDLVSVVLEEKMAEYADRTEAAAEEARRRPWEAFQEYVLFTLEQQASDLCFSDVILDAGTAATHTFRTHIDRAFRAWVMLVDRSVTAGAVRPDFHHSDLYLLQRANAGLLRDTRKSAPQAWKRLAAYMIEAFRAPGTGALADPPQAWAR